MKISIKERMMGEAQLLNHQMLFDIIVRPYYGESEEKVNKKGNRFRNKVDKLKVRGSWVGNFMSISDGEVHPHAFFVITCPSGSRERMKTIMRENIEDGDLIIFG